MNFIVLDRNERKPPTSMNTAYLEVDYWNDYSFITAFYLTVFDEKGNEYEIGNVKIAFKGQTTDKATYVTLGKNFSNLSDQYFSLGTDVEYYKNLSKLDPQLKRDVLISLEDIVYKPERIKEIEDEVVLNTSLFRGVTLSDVHGQFSRVLNGLAELSDYDFSFVRENFDGFCDLKIPFKVKVGSIPSTNIHAFIGRNGCGKTTILNGMIDAITNPNNESCYFTESDILNESRIPNGYFRSLVSVSFSAFDPFTPPHEQPDPAKGTKYFYIGLKNRENSEALNSLVDLRKDFVSALIGCLSNEEKKDLWLDAIDNLSSDKNFENMGLSILNTRYVSLKEKHKNIQTDNEKFEELFYLDISNYLQRMSSGHAIVLFTITRLVNTVGEKSLVLLDEPEGHLHPPLLSSFLRTLSDLLYLKNGVAIIATHSPVVLQEIPKSCVWKVTRSREVISVDRPEIETFGENLGVLTREVFALEVANSGYHSLLTKSVESGASYDALLSEYKNQIGLEGRTVLKAMVLSRDAKKAQ
ncbi:putative AbiEii toxin of type IV toxin-antitoxin system [Idiomarina loihiensis]|uniref:ATP-dependent nuclease n=1 Tax=Idiomarina TaxID=135575 RepID=UPI0002EF8E65|nr:MULTISPECIES: AAA family ATPase [Idiomarina]NWO03850.1 AAA family ATPase [Idiomarinaceae bacterium]PWW38516.1 putative AbiEii toxin of type IV toxin-antitoxin system [Idiomarina loihiensis]TDP48410.1 putative AbiEii toxin of type IV toxin-antitoxin system [Idiomarina loihiensis]TDS23576.1 putative AbiEii toxin of type IV toxin-antitoxin system [Idiomarina sp. H2]